MKKTFPIVTAMAASSSADVFANIVTLYIPPGSRVADVTYGKGVFWRRVPDDHCNLIGTDIVGGMDFRDLPYSRGMFDALILDPPYMARGGGWGEGGPGKRYRNVVRSQHIILDDYVAGIGEARRVLRLGGVIILKCQDGIEHGKQHWMHSWIMSALECRGFEIEDLFIQVRRNTPPMRHRHQRHARKNHSYFIVARKKRRKAQKRRRGHA